MYGGMCVYVRVWCTCVSIAKNHARVSICMGESVAERMYVQMRRYVNVDGGIPQYSRDGVRKHVTADVNTHACDSID